MIVLDTTVLLHAVGAEHELREPCRRLLEAPRTLGLTTTAGVIQEFVHVRARRRPRPEAVDLARAFLTLLRPLLDVGENAVERALELIARHSSLGPFDALLAGAALNASCRAVVTADRAFGHVDGLDVVFPDQDGVDGLLPAQSGSPA